MGIVDTFAEVLLPLGTNGQRLTIDCELEEAISGQRFTALDYQIVGDGSVCNVIITTGTSKTVMCMVGIETSAAGVWRMSEGAVMSGASVLTALCNNRILDLTPESVCTKGGEVVSSGTIIGYHVIGSTTGGASKSGGTSGGTNPWILKHSTSYLFQFTSEGASNDITQGIFFCER